MKLGTYYVACLAFLALSMIAVATPLPLIEMDFNTPAGEPTLTNRGTIAPLAGTLGGGAALGNEHGPKNQGGNGGSFHGNGDAIDFGNPAQLNSLTSFTVSAWVKPTQTKNKFIVSKSSGSSGFSFYLDKDGRLALDVNNGSVSANILPAVGAWTFVAVTYNGTAAANNVTFYSHTGGDAWDASITSSLNKGSTQSNTGKLLLGYGPVSNRAWQGSLDNIRVYGATSGTSAVLSSEELLTVMEFNDAPEPVTLLTMAVTLPLLRRRAWKRARDRH